MSDYKFDGNKLKDHHGSKIGEVDRDYIRDNRGRRVGKIDGKYIRDSHGSKLAEFDGKYIRDSHGRKIGTISDVLERIDGPGGTTLVALWVLLVR